MRHKLDGDHPLYGDMFARYVELPDELGAVVRYASNKGQMHIVCEHGTHICTLPKRDPQMMAAKGRRAKVIHTMRRAT